MKEKGVEEPSTHQDNSQLTAHIRTMCQAGLTDEEIIQLTILRYKINSGMREKIEYLKRMVDCGKLLK